MSMVLGRLYACYTRFDTLPVAIVIAIYEWSATRVSAFLSIPYLYAWYHVMTGLRLLAREEFPFFDMKFNF